MRVRSDHVTSDVSCGWLCSATLAAGLSHGDAWCLDKARGRRVWSLELVSGYSPDFRVL